MCLLNNLKLVYMLNSQPGEPGNMPENGNAFSLHATAFLVSRTFLLRIYMLCAWATFPQPNWAQTQML